FAFATGPHPVFTLTIVSASITGRPGRASVMSCLKNALSLIMPVRSGYGPAVSSAVTAQIDGGGVVTVVDAAVVTAVRPAGLPPQPAASAAPAALSSSSAWRRLSRPWCKSILAPRAAVGPTCKGRQP